MHILKLFSHNYTDPFSSQSAKQIPQLSTPFGSKPYSGVCEPVFPYAGWVFCFFAGGSSILNSNRHVWQWNEEAMLCKIHMHNFKSHFQQDFLAYCTMPVSVHLAMACVHCSFDSFSIFLLSLKQHQNLMKIMFSSIHFPIRPYSPQIIFKKTVFYTGKLYGLTGTKSLHKHQTQSLKQLPSSIAPLLKEHFRQRTCWYQGEEEERKSDREKGMTHSKYLRVGYPLTLYLLPRSLYLVASTAASLASGASFFRRPAADM